MEELTFNIEDAKERMVYVLSRKKNEYSNNSIKEFVDIKNSIQWVLNDDERLEKLVIIQLTYDIRYMLRLFNTTNGYVYHMNNLLCSAIHGSVKLVAQRGLVIDYDYKGKSHFQKFNSSEELRAFLYDLVGFIYQPKKEVHEIMVDEVDDPMICPNYDISPALSFLGDLDIIEDIYTPKLKSKQKRI